VSGIQFKSGGPIRAFEQAPQNVYLSGGVTNQQMEGQMGQQPQRQKVM